MSTHAGSRSLVRLERGTLIAWLLVIVGLVAVSVPFRRMLREVGACIPDSTDAVHAAVDALLAGRGLVGPLALAALIVAPSRLGAREAATRAWLWLWLAQGIVSGLGLGVCATLLPLEHLCSGTSPGPHMRAPNWGPLVPAAGVAALQLVAWAPLALEVARAASGSWRAELARVAFVATAPAAILAATAYAALRALDVGASWSLLVPVPLAGAGTAALGVVALGVVVRSRLASSERLAAGVQLEAATPDLDGPRARPVVERDASRGEALA